MDEKRNKAVLPLVLLAQFIIIFMVTALFVLVPVVEQTFNVQADQVCWIEIGYLLTLSAFSIPFGRISDLVGRRKILLLGLVFFGVISFMCMYAYTIQLLIILRTVQGVAAAMIMSAANAILIEAYPAHRRGSVLGISACFSFLGTIIGQTVGNYLNNYFRWQSAFLVAAILAAAAIVLCIAGLEPDEIRRGENNIDSRGVILLVVGIALILLSLSMLPSIIATLVFLTVGISLLILFLRYEKHSDNPLIKPGIIADRIFILTNGSVMLCYAASLTLICLIGAYLYKAHLYNMNSANSGSLITLLIWFCLAAAVAAPIAGIWSDRRPLNHMSSSAMVISMVSCVMCFFLTKTPSVCFVSVLLLLAGAGSGVFAPVVSRVVFSRVKQTEDGIANSILNTSYSVGRALCMIILSIVFSNRVIYLYDIRAVGDSLLTVIRVAAVVTLVLYGAAAFLSLKRERLEAKERSVR